MSFNNLEQGYVSKGRPAGRGYAIGILDGIQHSLHATTRVSS